MKRNLKRPSCAPANSRPDIASSLVPVLIAAVALAPHASAQTFAPLPQGNTGIAARYPGDVGIAGDSAVIFADNFESYANASGLAANWNGGVYHNVRIAAESDNVYAGTQALEFRSPQQTQELSNGVGRELDKSHEVDMLFLRYYTKFDESFDIWGSCHNGGGMSAYYFVDGNATPGVPADGTNKFLAEFESWRGDSSEQSPGQLNVYIYHPEQRTQWGDHWFPDGTVLPWTYLPGDFGDEFVSRTNITCELGRWYCCELMVKANTVGERDGRIACWLDGALIADFPNLRLRDVDTLKLNRFNLSLHSGSNPAGETWKWYDNVVAARSYIGPTVSVGAVRRPGGPNAQSQRRTGLSVSGETVSFSLARASPVTLRIYTAQGRMAGKLVDRTLGAGTHVVRWDGRGEGTRRASGGVYLTRLRRAQSAFLQKIAVMPLGP